MIAPPATRLGTSGSAQYARMAEWSKAPDSSDCLPRDRGSGFLVWLSMRGFESHFVQIFLCFFLKIYFNKSVHAEAEMESNHPCRMQIFQTEIRLWLSTEHGGVPHGIQTFPR